MSNTAVNSYSSMDSQLFGIPQHRKVRRGLSDIDPKYVSQSGLCTMSELDGPRGSIRIQHRSPHHGKGIQTQGSVVSGTFFPSTGHTNVARKSSLTNLHMSHLMPNGKARITEQISNTFPKDDDTMPRFPRLQDCAHFHYEYTEFGPLHIRLNDEEEDARTVIDTNFSSTSTAMSLSNPFGNTSSNIQLPSAVGNTSLPITTTTTNVSFVTSDSTSSVEKLYVVEINSRGKTWSVKRNLEDFRLLDRQCHQCVYDRKYSQLSEIPLEENLDPNSLTCQNNISNSKDTYIRQLLITYLARFSALAGDGGITCGTVLNWLELDNRGNRLIVTDDSTDINTPAVAAAYATKRYAKQASDEISFEVGDMISVIDMPPPEESVWWRGKRGFEVGFFPCECVEVIGDSTKGIPHGLTLHTGHNHLNSNDVMMTSSGSSTSTQQRRKDSVTDSDDADDDDSSPTGSSGGGNGSTPNKPVLRKHGKLISFFRSFILSRPARGKLKKSGILKERVFGCDLSEHLLNSGQPVPKVLVHCAEFIEERGIVDGIYRLGGVASNIQRLRVAFDEDRVPSLYDDQLVMQDIHSVPSLLKMYFRELPNPICTYHLYDKFVEAAKSSDDQRLVLLRDVVQQLPPPNYRTLEYLSRHLYRVSLRGNDTGMTAKNVAIVWAPNLLRSKSIEIGGVAALQGVGVQAVVTEYLIRYCELIFSDKMPSYSNGGGSSTLNGIGSPKKLRPKSLAISTPTKLLSLEEARSRALANASSCQTDNTQDVSILPTNTASNPGGSIPAGLPANISQDQKYIEVGGGPSTLPQKYHTVIEISSTRKGMNRSTRGSRRSPLWKDIFKTGKTRTKSSENNSANKLSIPPELEDIMKAKKNCQMDEVAAAAAGVNEADLRNAFPRDQMLRPVKSAESLVTASINHPQRTQSDRVACTTTQPGVAANLLASENKSEATSSSIANINGGADKDDESIKYGEPTRNISFRNEPNQATDSTSMVQKYGSRQLSTAELDEVGELEQVAQAVTNLKQSIISSSRTSSPKCHSRSSSHDSYFDKKLASSVVQFKMEDDGDTQDNSIESPGKNVGDNASLDLSEIQVNFELEDNEMKIFSEDEAMLTNSCGSDLSKSLAGNSVFDDDIHQANAKHAKNSCKQSSSNANEETPASPKNRRMSFREKFKIFTSPNSGRKTEGDDGNETQQSNIGKDDSTKKTSIKDKVLGTLSPESMRKRNNILGNTVSTNDGIQYQSKTMHQVSPMKKKSSSPTLGTSPNNTSNLVKRSKIENDEGGYLENNVVDKNTSSDEVFEAESEPKPCGIPLSPSIQFMDESVESTSKFDTNHGESDVVIVEYQTTQSVPSNGHGISLSQNPRFSTASTSSAASNDQTNGNKSDSNHPVESQLVIAQVHHDPIVEKKYGESIKDEKPVKESAKIEKEEVVTEERNTSEALNNLQQASLSLAIDNQQGNSKCMEESKTEENHQLLNSELKNANSSTSFENSTIRRENSNSPSNSSISIAAATVSENESLSFPSTEDNSISGHSALRSSSPAQIQKDLLLSSNNINIQQSQYNYDQVIDNAHSQKQEKSMHYISNEIEQLDKTSKENNSISIQVLNSVPLVEPNRLQTLANPKTLSEDENDVVMVDESDERQSSLPPSLPVKQMVHITNHPLIDESTITSSNEPNVKMELDVLGDGELDNKQSCIQNAPDENMEICNEPSGNLQSIPDADPCGPIKSVSLISSVEQNRTSKIESPFSIHGINSGNITNQGDNSNIIFDSSNDCTTAERKPVSNENSYPDHFISNYSSGPIQPKIIQENVSGEINKTQGKNENNSFKHVPSVQSNKLEKKNLVDLSKAANEMSSNSGYAKNNISIFGSTAHSNFIADNKGTLTSTINNTSDTNLNQVFVGKPIAKARDIKPEDVGAVEDNKKDCVSKNDDKKDQKHSIVNSTNEDTKSTTNTSPTYAKSSSKMVQSRTNSLSSTSSNSVTVQSLFLSTPMPYSKPTCYSSTTTPSPVTNSYEVVNDEPIETFTEINNEKSNQSILGKNISIINSDNKISENCQKNQHINACRVKSTPSGIFSKKEHSMDHKVDDTRSRKNSVGFMKSRFEAMDYTDTSSETDMHSTPEPTSSDDSTSQPNSLTGGNVHKNLPRFPADGIESGRSSSQGFSWIKSNQTIMPDSSSHFDSNLLNSKKSSLKSKPKEEASKKLSTVSLQEAEAKTKKVTLFGDFPEDEGDQSPLQRRNSIHNVPYVDVNDPSTRARMERYKEERRSTLRAKYKAEDYRSEKQQKSPSPSNSIEIDSLVPPKETNTVNSTSSMRSDQSYIPKVENESSTISESNNVEVVIDNTKVQLRKLPVESNRSNRVVDYAKIDPSQVKTTNVKQAKTNADRKWSLQTGVKPQQTQNDTSNSTSNTNRSSCPPQSGQIDDDVNVKERAAFWNGSKNVSASNNVQKLDKRSSVTEKPTIKNNQVHRKISEPVPPSPYIKSASKVVGKEKRVKSLSLSTTPPTTHSRPQSMEEKPNLMQSTKTIFLKSGNSDDNSTRQSSNIHLPSPNKIKNMAAFFEQNN